MLMSNHLHVIAAPILDREAKLGNFSRALKHWIRQELTVMELATRLFRSTATL